MAKTNCLVDDKGHQTPKIFSTTNQLSEQVPNYKLNKTMLPMDYRGEILLLDQRLYSYLLAVELLLLTMDCIVLILLYYLLFFFGKSMMYKNQ